MMKYSYGVSPARNGLFYYLLGFWRVNPTHVLEKSSVNKTIANTEFYLPIDILYFYNSIIIH